MGGTLAPEAEEAPLSFEVQEDPVLPPDLGEGSNVMTSESLSGSLLKEWCTFIAEEPYGLVL